MRRKKKKKIFNDPFSRISRFYLHCVFKDIELPIFQLEKNLIFIFHITLFFSSTFSNGCYLKFYITLLIKIKKGRPKIK